MSRAREDIVIASRSHRVYEGNLQNGECTSDVSWTQKLGAKVHFPPFTRGKVVATSQNHPWTSERNYKQIKLIFHPDILVNLLKASESCVDLMPDRVEVKQRALMN